MPTLSLPEFEAEIKSGTFRPVYALLGPEVYLRRQAVDLLHRNAVPEQAKSFNEFEFSAKDPIREILIAAQTFPFGSPRRLIVVNDLELMSVEAQQKELIAYVKGPSTKTVLVLVGDELDRRLSFYRTLKEKTFMVEFPLLKGYALESWAGQYIGSLGYRIGATSLKKLVALAGSDMQSIVTEVEKLILYAGTEKSVPDTAVDKLVTESKEHTIFELTNAMGRRDSKAALRLLSNLMETEQNAIGIVVMVARHFRQMLIAIEMIDAGRRPEEIAAAAQIPGFVLNDFLRQAHGFDWQTARTIFLRLADLNLKFCSSSVDQRAMLEDLICNL